MRVISLLHELRAASGPRRTQGLSDEWIAFFESRDPSLSRAVEEAAEAHRALRERSPAQVAMAEPALIASLQQGFVNFYRPQAINPYVPLAAAGPWIITLHGAVLHDSGGYGMLGLGHAPLEVLEAMGGHQVMANVMTASLSQGRFNELLRAELGHRRSGGCPFAKFICLNSGSESVTMALRLSDINAGRRTKVGTTIKIIGFSGAFHGRTDRPSQASDSCMPVYLKHLATYRGRDNLVTVPHNDVAALEAAFAEADAQGVFIEAVMLEPVQGEGAPGRALSRAFYDRARALTLAHGSLLIIDSIQAGLRAHGVLSIVDYPGFEDCEVPDVETWSKALNAGQYPLSVLGLSAQAAALYVQGVYGNTMTTNPRALDVANAVLQSITPALRQNIRDRGAEFVAGLKELAGEFPGLITGVEGTGLLLAAELDPDRPVVGVDGIEERCRLKGIGVVHGGKNALRFTPHFAITSEEIRMLLALMREVFQGLAEIAA